MSKLQIFHNPRCSKSRQALCLLQGTDHDIEIHEYLRDPPTPAFLDSVLFKLNLNPIEIIRTNEPEFKDLGLSLKDSRTRMEWIEILCGHPKLIERPIVIAEDKAVIGRPPENVLTLC